MTALVATILVFVFVGCAFLAGNLLLGKLIRPSTPTPEKGEVYECGEQPIGSAWIQFDLRFYVVALLFVIFDVEIAFFFPWAVVFGSANQLADPARPEAERAVARARLDPTPQTPAVPDPSEAAAAGSLARLAFVELMVFFGILLVGFAYLWRRGDLEWVRSVAGQIRETKPIPLATASGAVEP